jgi:GNAT superfamily N-acetyltransferase
MIKNRAAHQFSIRALTDQDRAWVADFTAEHWGSDKMVVHGDLFSISQLPGFCAEMDGEIAGLVTYAIANGECEILSLDSLYSGLGIGTQLIEVVKEAAIQHHCQRLFLATTNDNIDALLFYQKRGFVLAALRRGAVIESRRLKPEIPLNGDHGLPIRDEIEFEMDLKPA